MKIGSICIIFSVLMTLNSFEMRAEERETTLDGKETTLEEKSLAERVMEKEETEMILEGIRLKDCEAWYYQAKGENAKGKTVLILPGGGYSHHAMDHEGHAWAAFFNQLGVNVAVLKYKLPEGNLVVPLNDVKKAIEELQTHSAEWNIDPEDIGIMGFSAGGHLASAYATHSEGATKPAFQILFYPVISLKEELSHQGTRNSFLGSDQSEMRVLAYSGEEQVTSTTPPAIIFHSYDDKAVVVDNSINYFQALRKAGIEASLHIYPKGGHGWGFRENFPYHEAMVEELKVWIREIGD